MASVQLSFKVLTWILKNPEEGVGVGVGVGGGLGMRVRV